MCVSPSYFWLQRGPNWERIPKGCGECWRCRSNKVSDYVGRALAEASTSDWSVALTLTYAPRDDLAEKVITPVHFQKFVRALRRRGYVIRYLAAGEYGKLRGRAHFHCVLFGKGKRPSFMLHKQRSWHDVWPHGHMFADWDADDKAMRYVAKYILKDADQSWFTLSKKPTLGSEFFKARAAEYARLGVMPSGFEYLPPGGQRKRPYLMTGATRRDFMVELRRLMGPRWDDAVGKSSQWVYRAALQAEEYVRRRELGLETPEEMWQALVETVEKKRPDSAQQAAIERRNRFIDAWHEVEWDVVNTYESERKTSQTGTSSQKAGEGGESPPKRWGSEADAARRKAERLQCRARAARIYGKSARDRLRKEQDARARERDRRRRARAREGGCQGAANLAPTDP